MHGTVPLLRSATAAIAHSQSRIPHINLHIIQNRSSSLRTQNVVKTARRVGRRHQSTSVDATIWRQFAEDAQEEPVSSVLRGISTSVKSSNSIDSIAELTVESNKKEEEYNLHTILDGGNPDQILHTLLDEKIGMPFLRYAPDELFERAVLALDPEHFVESYKELYRYIFLPSDRKVKTPIWRIEDRFNTLMSQLDKIITVRTEAGNQLSLDICRHMLKWAGCLGNEALATQIMQIVEGSDDMKPDVECHNYYLQATTWNGAFIQATKFRLRVTSLHLKLRAAVYPPKKLSGHRTANPSQGISGVRVDTLRIFKQLIEKDLTADEFTFVNLMIGMSREADIPGVKSVLKSVWNIDVDLLYKYDEDEIESPTFYDTDSPLRPSERLLFAIVHIFGSNNDAQTAWLLVDYVSRNYDLKISEMVWHHLLEWYLVLSLPRSAYEVKQGSKKGHVKPEVLTQMFNVMQDEPFNIKPTGVMHYLISRSERDRHRLVEQLSAIRSLRESLAQQRLVVDKLSWEVEEFLEKLKKAPADELMYNFGTDQYFFQLSDKFVKASIGYEALKRLMRHAVKQNLFIEHYARPYHPTQDQWERQIIPELVEEFTEFLPPLLKYRTSTGDVIIDCYNHYTHETNTKYGKWERNIAQMRQALDVHHHENRFNRVKTLAHSLRCAKCNSMNHYTSGCEHSEPQTSVFLSAQASSYRVRALKLEALEELDSEDHKLEDSEPITEGMSLTGQADQVTSAPDSPVDWSPYANKST